ncbi:MAG: hypothetical protein ACXVZP_07295 [Gaiellaceae bacterium]
MSSPRTTRPGLQPAPADGSAWQRWSGVASSLLPRSRTLAERIARSRWWREPWTVLVPLILVQWLALLMLVASVKHSGWLFYQGGDETFFYTSSWTLCNGHLPVAQIGYAWPLLTCPIAAASGPSILSALPALLLLQVVVLLPIALLAAYGVGSRIGGRAIGYLAAVAWVLAPYLIIPGFVERYHEKYVELTIPQALGLTAMGDFPSMVVVLCAAYFALRAMDEGRTIDAVVAGLLAGFALGIKPSNGPFLAAPFLGLLLTRRFRGTVAFGAALLPSLLTLAIWKERGLGQLPVLDSMGSTPELAGLAMVALPLSALNLNRYLPLDWHHLHNNFLGIREVFWSWRLVEYLPLAGAIAVARRSIAKAAFVAVWLAAFVVVKGSSSLASIDSASFWRLLMPAWPAYLMLVVSLPLLVPRIGRLLPDRFPVRPGRIAWRSPVVPAGSFVLALVPLLAVSFLPVLHQKSELRIHESNLLVPVSSRLQLRLTHSGRNVSLRWRREGGGSSQVFYRVFRVRVGKENVPGRFLFSAGEGASCPPPPMKGALDCTLGMPMIATTNSPRFVDHPPPGRWWYRVGEAANWLGDPSQGDVLLLSTAAGVRIP